MPRFCVGFLLEDNLIRDRAWSASTMSYCPSPIHQESEGKKTENSEGAAPSPSPAFGMADQLTGMGGRGRAGAAPGAHRSGRRASVAQGVAGPPRPGAVRVAVAR